MERLAGKTVYIDTNIFGYFLSGNPTRGEAARDVIQCVDAGVIRGVTSEVTLAELLVVPFRRGDEKQAAECFELLRARAGLALFPVSREVLIEAARIRGVHGLKLPDAIHAATASLAGCGVALTNDEDWRGLPGIEIIGLPQSDV